MQKQLAHLKQEPIHRSIQRYPNKTPNTTYNKLSQYQTEEERYEFAVQTNTSLLQYDPFDD